MAFDGSHSRKSRFNPQGRRSRFRAKPIQGIKTQTPIRRPGGKPSNVELLMTNELIRNAAVVRGWLIENNRVATGEAVNSIAINITRNRGASGVVKKTRLRGISNPNVRKAARTLKASNVGAVSGEIVGVPHLTYALEGRGAGAFPNVQDILEWMMVKGVGASDTTISLQHQAYLIARKISQEGTDPPFFDNLVKRKMVRVSSARIVRLLSIIFSNVLPYNYVRVIEGLGKGFDAVKVTKVTPTQKKYEEFI